MGKDAGMNGFRFGFTALDIPSREAFVERCRRAERYGYDVVNLPDHLGIPSPFVTAVAAADATERLRVGTLVLNAGFWNAHLLAREIMTADRLTGGRVEVGLGAGFVKWEFEAAGILWEPFAARVARLAALIEELGRLFASPGYALNEPMFEHFGVTELAPVQRTGFGGAGPPLLVGGTGDTVLRIAARHAGIVGVAGTFQVPGEPPGTLRIGTAEQAAERVAFVRAQAGDRADAIEWNTLVQHVEITADRRSAAERVRAERLPYLTVEQILDTPFLLIGTRAQIAEQIRERRERFGFSYVCVLGPYTDALGSVIEQL